MLNLAVVPRSAFVLGFAGLLPFLWGIGTLHVRALHDLTMSTVGPRFVAPFVILSYGQIILAFMSGVIWGFAARTEGEAQALGFGLSVIPALWAFFFVGGGPAAAATYLIAGFIGVLMIDFFFWRNGLTPRWWMALRVPLTAVVCLCLATVAFG
jgi:hypothetical protein